jgi:SAM-dependent methyltransferase
MQFKSEAALFLTIAEHNNTCSFPQDYARLLREPCLYCEIWKPNDGKTKVDLGQRSSVSVYFIGVNYNQLAERFDQRYRHQPYLKIQSRLRQLVDRPGMDVLEVGCGTGHWLSTLRDLPARFLGADPSLAMLVKARSVAVDAEFICTGAEELPFVSHSLDLVFCVNAFHHFYEPRKFIEDCRAVLKTAGRLAIFGLDPHVPGTEWYLYDCFPGIREIDLKRYLAHKEIGALMTEAGFQSVITEPVQHIRRVFIGEEVLSDPFLDRESTSQLQLISIETYRRGKETIVSILESTDRSENYATFNLDLTLLATVGVAPED